MSPHNPTGKPVKDEQKFHGKTTNGQYTNENNLNLNINQGNKMHVIFFLNR